MKEKLLDIIYDVCNFLINSKWAFAIFFLLICGLIAYFILYPLNPSVAIGFTSGAIGTTIYRFLKNDE